MRFCALIIFAAAFVLCVWLERPVAFKTLPADQELKEGVSNPPLRQLGNTWPIERGTPLWMHPTRSSFGRVIEIEGDLAIVEPTAGKEGAFRIQQKYLKNAWIPK